MAGSKAARTQARPGAAAQAGPAARKGGGSRGTGDRPRQGQQNRAQAPRKPVAAEAGALATGAGVPSWLQWSTLVLAVGGLGVSIYLTVAHYTQSSLAGCTEKAGLVDCGKVTTSPESIVLGIPVAVLGLAFYVFMVAIMSPYAWRSRRREVALARMLSLVAGIGFVIYLLYAELFEIGNICLYCTAVHVITFVLFVLTVLGAAVWGGTSQASGAGRPRR
jgi:uncharacterized membrane protein